MALDQIIENISHIHAKNPDKSTHHYAIATPSGKINKWHEKITITTNANYCRGIMPSIHAEADIIKKIGRYRNVPSEIDIFVIRLSKNGVIGESRPCYHCVLKMSKSRLNIKYIYYTQSDGTIAKKKFSDMVSRISCLYISNGVKRTQNKKTPNVYLNHK
jgi:hypothetical protein